MQMSSFHGVEDYTYYNMPLAVCDMRVIPDVMRLIYMGIWSGRQVPVKNKVKVIGWEVKG